MVTRENKVSQKRNDGMIRALLISVVLVVGVLWMISVHLTVEYIYSWIVVCMVLAFLWIPYIKGLSSKYIGLTKVLNQSIVEYKEFKETVFPLLEINLGIIGSTGYLSATPKPNIMIDFIQRIEKLAQKNIYDEDSLSPLIAAAKSQTLAAFSNDLNLILTHALSDEYNGKVEDYIATGLEDDYSRTNYINPDEIHVDIEALKQLGSQISKNSSAYRRYFKKITELQHFYKQYYLDD